MNLNDPQFREFYRQRGLQGKRVSRAEAQALWAEYSGNQEAATKQATSLLDSVQDRPAMTPNAASLSQDTFSPVDLGITRTTQKDPILATAEEAGAREASAQQPTKPSAVDPMTALRSFAQTQLGPQIDNWRNRRRQINETQFRSASAKRQAFESLDSEIAETITELQMRDAWTPEADQFYGEAIKTGTPSVEAFTRAVDRLVRPKTEAQSAAVGLAPEVIEQIRGLQQARDAELQAAENAQDDAIAVSSRQRAAAFDRQIDALKGTPERSPWDKWQEIRRAEDEITAKTELNGGTVSYRGVPVSFENFPSLTPIIARDRADILTQLASDRTQLPVSRVNATIKDPKTGKIDKEATAQKYAELLTQAKVGDPIEDFETGEVRIYTGPQEAAKERDWVPKSIQPAMRGAREVASKVYDKAAPTVRQISDNAATTVKMITRPARENLQSFPTIALARYGLEYLSQVGRKAEEEEKKRLAGQ